MQRAVEKISRDHYGASAVLLALVKRVASFYYGYDLSYLSYLLTRILS